MRLIHTAFLSLFICSTAFAAYQQEQNPFTGLPDYVGVSASKDIAIVCASGQTLTTTGGGTWACATGVSSVSNSDGTLTISPTTGAVLAGLNLANPNTWTGKQTFNTTAPSFGTMTAGSVFFAGTSGILSQDNANFFWDDSFNYLGIGTNSPNSALHVTGALTLGGINSEIQSGFFGGTIFLYNGSNNSIAIGRDASANTETVSIGYNAVSSSLGTALGAHSGTGGSYSLALGYGAQTVNTSEIVMTTNNSSSGTLNTSGLAYTQFNIHDGKASLHNNSLGIGTASPATALHIIKTTEQLRLGYDVSNYFSTTVGSTGGVTFNAVGAGAGFTFNDAVTVPLTSTNASAVNYAVSGSVTKSGSDADTSGFDVIAGRFTNTNTFALTGTDVFSPATITNYGLVNGVTANGAHTRTLGEEGSAIEINIGIYNTVFRGSGNPPSSATITTNPFTISNYGIQNIAVNYAKYNNAGGTLNNQTYGGYFQVASAPTLTAGTMYNTNYGFYAVVSSTTVGTNTNYGAYISVSGTSATNWGFYNGSSSANLAHNYLGGDNTETRMGNSSDLVLYHDGTNSRIKNITGKLILHSPTTVEIGTGAAGVDYILQFNGETNDGVLTWMEDEDYFKFSDDIFMTDAENIVLDTTTGTKIGTATTQKLAFHNSTPVIQRAGAAQAAVATTGATNVAPYGFTTSAQADAIVTLVNEIRAALVEKGLIKGSA